MCRWLEREGYDVSYATNVDLDENKDLLLKHRAFLAVGAYPPSGTYDECGPSVEEHARAVKAVRKVVRPRSDPVLGAKGPLLELWQASRSRR